MRTAMKKIFTFLSLIACIFQTALNAIIIETAHFDEISQYADSDTLVILDIDDTILIPNQMLGCDEWFNKRLQEQQDKGKSFIEALDKTLFEWEGLRSLTEMQTCEKNTTQIIDELQEKNISVMCLTTQRFALAPRTVYQLEHQKIDMTKTSPTQENLFFMNQNLGVLFFKGILFTNGTHKGKSFFQFADQIGYQPKKILFVNDKASHLKELEQTCIERKIPFTGLRYAYSDKKKSEFSYTLAKIQSDYLSLNGIISDEQAEIKK